MTAEAVGIYFDYSKQRITDETLRLLLRLTEESNLRARIDAMFRGEKINVTEKRAVLHVALRAPKASPSWRKAKTSCRRSAQCLQGWPISPTEFAVANGKATPANGSEMSSILV